MELIRETLYVLFNERESEQVLNTLLDSEEDGTAISRVDERWFVNAFRDDKLHYTDDQRKNIWSLLTSSWMKADKSWRILCPAPRSSIFNVMLHFSFHALDEQKGMPVCDFDSILRWHSLTSQLDEDLFTTSYLASKDVALGRQRNVFGWPTLISTNNSQLNQMFEHNMADLHNHLYGSSDNFILNWMSLMRDVKSRGPEFNKIKKYMEPKRMLTPMSSYCPLHLDVIKAAAIRQYLLCPDESKRNSPYLYAVLRSTCLEEALLFYDDIYSPYMGMELTGRLDETPVLEERRFLYTMFRKIYDSSASDFSTNLLYAYLIIKYRVKHELMQFNTREGFANFADYEQRKKLFIRKGSQYDRLLVGSFIDNFFGSKSTKRYLETRITPKDAAWKIAKDIKSIESYGNTEGKDVHFIIHFIKTQDKELEKASAPFRCRHQTLREEIKKKALALAEWKDVYGNNGKIVGVDAANSEIFCRPEVFAQAFRFLREQFPPKDISVCDKPVSWGFTYHVGEDFLGVVDGLRAVDEVLHFMNFRQGDRFGHALVLGVDVDDYYARRHNRVSLPKQVLLDNVVWLLVKGRMSTHYINVYNKLVWHFERLSREIYGVKHTFNDYYDSWLLRGDNPECYMTTEYDTDTFGYWDICNRNFHDKAATVAFKNSKAKWLCHLYHYHNKAKENGEIREVFEVDTEYVALIKDMQTEMLCEVERRKIAIETNPTSNFKIGNLRRYSCHPILTFYNVGLELDDNQSFHAIPVSINTDDLGVFGTSLEREFTLMAAALEKDFKKRRYKNPPRIIYRWLDDIREQAFEQKFG